MKSLFAGLGLAALCSGSLAYAGDCSRSFEQSCLSSGYNRRQIEHDHEAKAESMEESEKAQAAQAAKEAAAEERRAVRADYERRQHEQAERAEERKRKMKERLEEFEKKYGDGDEDFFEWPSAALGKGSVSPFYETR
jgi:hypothetical protein